MIGREDDFKFFLARELGMTVRELDARMGSKEFSKWGILYERWNREQVAARNKSQVMGK